MFLRCLDLLRGVRCFVPFTRVMTAIQNLGVSHRRTHAQWKETHVVLWMGWHILLDQQQQWSSNRKKRKWGKSGCAAIVVVIQGEKKMNRHPRACDRSTDQLTSSKYHFYTDPTMSEDRFHFITVILGGFVSSVFDWE